ncbi:MAG: transmembrane NAD(P) transhydrogenase subunit alpha [Osedax symbiont Rs2]|nr:MAG: transmembrane NAD(P) transhydrogenase subunit alpha [Osedax symbiont Rs2]
MDADTIIQQSNALAEQASQLAEQSADLASNVALLSSTSSTSGDPIIFNLTIFVLAIFIGFYVVWSVTPALHAPLMSVTNAISSVIIVGALIAVGPQETNFSTLMGSIAMTLAAVNIFGGFIVSNRMLAMFKKKSAKPGVKYE